MHFALRPKTDCMKENMCSECNACIQICTHQAIQLKVNQEGFAYPEIDSENASIAIYAIKYAQCKTEIKQNP